jgi:hypothetical protein
MKEQLKLKKMKEKQKLLSSDKSRKKLDMRKNKSLKFFSLKESNN